MRTLLISELFLPRVGGTPTWFHDVYSHYPSGEAVVLTDLQADDEDFDRHYSLPIVRIPMRMNDWGFLNLQSAKQYARVAQATCQLMRDRHMQIAHCARVMPEGVVGYLLWLFTRLPYCVYAHGEEIGTALASRQLTFLMRRAYGNARAIIANSRNTRSLLTEIGVAEAKIRVISPGVDINRFTPGDVARARATLGLAGQPLLLSVGRLQRRKGHDMTIRALRTVVKEFPNVKYAIAGAGEEEDRLRALAKHMGVGQHVHFAGRVPNEQLLDYYRACDLFVMPNREEANQDIQGFGIVFLEAAACAKPAIGGRSGGTNDAVMDGETGLLVDGESPCEIAEAMLSLLRDKAKAEDIGRRGRAHAVKYFSSEQVVKRIRQLE